MTRPTLGKTELRDAPTTPLRIIVGIVMAAAFVVVHLVMIVIDAEVALEVSIMIGAFILVQEGIDVAQWGFKRTTDIDYQRAKNGTGPAVEVSAEHATVTAEIEAAAQSTPAPSTPTQLQRDD